mgnify:CR=1 FL=1
MWTTFDESLDWPNTRCTTNNGQAQWHMVPSAWQDSTSATATTVGKGEAGVAVPYSVRSDDVLSLSLLLCFVLFVVSLSGSRHAVARQLKWFFRPRLTDEDVQDTWSWFTVAMVFVDCVLLGLLTFILVSEWLLPQLDVEHPALFTALLGVLFLVYFLVKWLLYTIVNNVFFDGKKCLLWNKSFLMLITMEGVLLLPLALLVVYFNLSLEKATWCVVFVLILNKMLAFFKMWMIFFRQNGRFIQNILYLCALEFTP